MSKNKRFLSKWSVRIMFGRLVLQGYEHHAGRWVTDRILWQSCGQWRNQMWYQWFCENGRYLTVGPSVHWDLGPVQSRESNAERDKSARYADYPRHHRVGP